MTIKKRIASIILFLALIITIGGELFSAFVIRASAEGAVSHSNVLDDLERDDSFDPADYPADANDYSLQVIQVAESSNGELFVYVYQPSDAVKDLRASKINMSLQEPSDRDLTYNLYNLTWLNSNGVFDKYVVDGLTVSDEAFRYYTITSILRAFDDDIDIDETGDNSSTNLKAFPVSRSWCLYWYNGVLFTECESINVLSITPISENFIRYREGSFFSFVPAIGNDGLDRHYYAFKPDNFKIDKIIDCKVSYSSQSVHRYPQGNELVGAEKDETISLYEDENVSFTGSGLFGKTYNWKRIQTTTDFIEEVATYTDVASLTEDVAGATYVLNFLETDYDINSDIEDFTRITKVSLVEVCFLSDSKVYRLGVVSDIITGSDNPVADEDPSDDLMDMIGLILFFVMVIALWNPISALVKFVFKILKWLFSVLIAIITFPFALLKWLFAKK